MPWRPTSLLGKVWPLALEGTTQKAMQGLAKKEDANFQRMLRLLKKGIHNGRGFKWKTKEGKGGAFTIYNVQRSSAPTKTKKKKKK